MKRLSRLTALLLTLAMLLSLVSIAARGRKAVRHRVAAVLRVEP